jgi:hypothetical protein
VTSPRHFDAVDNGKLAQSSLWLHEFPAENPSSTPYPGVPFDLSNALCHED